MSVDNEVSLAWLEDVFQRLRPEGEKKVVDYLEAVLEEIVFETKMSTRPSGLTFRTERL